MTIGKFWCTNPTKAARRYTQRFGVVMAFYMLTVFQVTAKVRAHPPSGWKLFVLSALPTLPVVALVVVIGVYLREERDEFKRVVQVRSMLWAVAATFVVSTFVDFLRSYGNRGALPPFVLFSIFWVVLGLAQAVQSIMNRVKDDEEPSA